MDPQLIYRKGGTANMPYTHCETRIVSLLDLKIPESATEAEYKDLYDQISRSKTPAAQGLTDAVNSVSLGIAPPVAFPTETVYGLGADATNMASIAGIFAAKGRPSDNPLIVHVASVEQLERLTGEPIPSVYSDLVREHWPGPLTILIPIPVHNSVFAPNVHPGQRTIGFRIPESKYARFFIAATGKPIAGPSANSSGKPSPTTARHVMDDMKGKINFILDGGNCDVGVESTVVDGLQNPPLILRPGGLSQDDLISHGKRFGNVWANVQIGYKQTHQAEAKVNGDSVPDEAPRAPGMKYKHYAPQGRMILFEGPNALRHAQAELDLILNAKLRTVNGSTEHKHKHQRAPVDRSSIAILTSVSWPQFAGIDTDTNQGQPPPPPATNGTMNHHHQTNTPVIQSREIQNHTIHNVNLGNTPRQIAQNLFAALRTCDDLKCQFILAEAPLREEIERVVVNGYHSVSNGDGDQEESLHQFDAVLERMRKAASLVVD